MRLFVCSAVLSMVVAWGAMAQTLSRADAEKMVVGLYAIDIAVDVCDLDLTREQEKRLDYWVEWAEKQLDIADRKLDKAYDGMVKEAEKDQAGFCKQMTPIANQALKELPPAM